MFKTLRMKLLFGLIPLLAIVAGLGIWAVVMLNHLGGRIDVILRENYRSVQAAEGMMDAVDGLDSAVLFSLAGEEKRARERSIAYRPKFESNLEIERHNVTLPNEQALADRLTSRYASYRAGADRFFSIPESERASRKAIYFGEILPLFNEIKATADEVLKINQANMESESRKAIETAAKSKRIMALALVNAIVVASLVVVVLSQSLLGPILAVTQAARSLAAGDVDQVVPATTRDELGELANAFNAMARTIREFRQAGTERLVRAQKTAQATIDSFPDPVVVVDTAGAVERTNPAARRILQLPTNDSTRWEPPATIGPVLADVLSGHPDHLPTGLEHAVCLRDDGQERFYLPRVLAIRGGADSALGAAVLLQDVTKLHLVDQLKSDMVSTVSHELKTPLTGLQMVVHLMLEEAVGPLNPKQLELLLAARQDSDRLLAMVNDLLDLTRIQQGGVALDLLPIDPAGLVREAIERFESLATDVDIELSMAVSPTLPRVSVDRSRMAHVFDNLIGNAIAHTGRRGSVTISAEADEGTVRFSVRDTGEGIAPEHLAHVFEKFYRVPGRRSTGGAGLGLAIAREIVVAHGGRIEANSKPGEGTEIRFTVPIETDRGEIR